MRVVSNKQRLNSILSFRRFAVVCANPLCPGRRFAEHIEVRLTPVAELAAHLEAYEKLGYSVDAR